MLVLLEARVWDDRYAEKYKHFHLFRIPCVTTTTLGDLFHMQKFKIEFSFSCLKGIFVDDEKWGSTFFCNGVPVGPHNCGVFTKCNVQSYEESLFNITNVF